MKKLPLLALFAIFTLITSVSMAQGFSWANQAGGPGSDQGYDISVAPNGNVFVCGWFSETALFGNETLTSFGMQDIFIACYDSAGVFKWVRQAGGDGNEVGAGVVADLSGNAYITGWFSETAGFGEQTITSAGSYDVFVAKYNADGDVLWVQSGGGPSDDYGNRLALGNDGGVCVSGSFRETIIIGDKELVSEGDRDILLAHFASEGGLMCAKRLGGASDDRGYGIYQDVLGNYFLTGFYSGKVNFDEIELVSPAIISSFLMKMSGQGNVQWVKSIAGNANDFARGFDVGVDNIGNVVTTGFFSGTAGVDNASLSATGGQFDFDIYLLKFDTQGEMMYAKSMGGNTIDHGRSLYVNGDGDVYLTGFYGEQAWFDDATIESTGKSDVFAVKYFSDGTFSWVMGDGGLENDYAYAISGDASGNLFMTGIFEGSAGFGDNNFESFGGNDIFITKITSGSSGISMPSPAGNIKVFPNPATESVTIDLPIANHKNGWRVEFLDDNGKTCYSREIDPNEIKINISTASFVPGLYFIRLLYGTKTFVARVVIQ